MSYQFSLGYDQYSQFESNYWTRLHAAFDAGERDSKELRLQIRAQLYDEARVKVVLVEDARNSFGTPGLFRACMEAEDEQTAVEFKLKWL